MHLWDVDIHRDNHCNRYSLLFESQTIREAGRARCTTDGNSFCRGLDSASSRDDVEPLKGPFVHSWARLLGAGRSSRRISCLAGMARCCLSCYRPAFFLVDPVFSLVAARHLASLLSCLAGVVDSLQSCSRVVSGVATDERWWYWRSLAELVRTLLLVDLMFTCCKRIRESF
jgi:hypothetical protein